MSKHISQNRTVRAVVAVVLVAVLAIGAYLVWPSRTGNKVVG